MSVAGAEQFSMFLAREVGADENDPGASDPAASSGQSSTTDTEGTASQGRDASEDWTAWVARVMPSGAAAIPAAPATTTATAPASASDASGAIGADESLRSSGAQRALQTLLAQANPGGFAGGANAQQANGQQSGAGSAQPGDGATTNGAALTSASTLSTANTPAGTNTPATASTLDAANALNPAGAAVADAMQTAAAATHLASSGASSNTLALQSELHAAVGTPEWAAELGGQLTWMAHHGIGSASLQLSPPDLGPIEVRIAVHGSAASVWFGATQPDTRAALEQALPRLHELFGAQGLALADASVSRESPQQQREPPAVLWGGAGAVQAPTESATQSTTALQRVGLLDLYA